MLLLTRHDYDPLLLTHQDDDVLLVAFMINVM